MFGKLIFDGEYINGNKKGKEYNNEGVLIFEGEYLDGKKWNGKIKEYSFDKLEFEGQLKNGKRNGYGKEYFSDGTLCFAGNYLNGQRINKQMKKKRK